MPRTARRRRVTAVAALERPTSDGPAESAPEREALASRVLSRSDLRSLPQPQPLIADTIDKRTVALLSGRRSCGKSFIALDWACCVSTGKAWQGREIADPGPVLYIAAEGAHGLDQRVTAWEYAWRHKVADLDVIPFPVNLFRGGVPFLELLELVRAREYRLVIVDTWARSTVGGKENDNTDSTIAFERLDQLRRLGPTVLAVAHTDSSRPQDPRRHRARGQRRHGLPGQGGRPASSTSNGPSARTGPPTTGTSYS